MVSYTEMKANAEQVRGKQVREKIGVTSIFEGDNTQSDFVPAAVTFGDYAKLSEDNVPAEYQNLRRIKLADIMGVEVVVNDIVMLREGKDVVGDFGPLALIVIAGNGGDATALISNKWVIEKLMVNKETDQMPVAATFSKRVSTKSGNTYWTVN